MRGFLGYIISFIVFGNGLGLSKISLDGMESSNDGKSFPQFGRFQNMKGLRAAHGSIGHFSTKT